jgi:hypothetical protein
MNIVWLNVFEIIKFNIDAVLARLKLFERWGTEDYRSGFAAAKVGRRN